MKIKPQVTLFLLTLSTILSMNNVVQAQDEEKTTFEECVQVARLICENGVKKIKHSPSSGSCEIECQSSNSSSEEKKRLIRKSNNVRSLSITNIEPKN